MSRQAQEWNPALQLLLEQGLAHHEAGRLPEAEQFYKQVLHADPNHADALHLYGVIAFTTGHLAEAEKLIFAAIHARRDIPLYHANLGNVFRANKQTDRAVAAYKRALALNPDMLEALNNLGLVLHAQGKLEEAQLCFIRALSQHPDVPELHNGLGLVLKDQGRLEDALTHYDRAIALRPTYADPHWNKAFILLLQGKFAEGWHENEWRWKIAAANDPGLTAPLWKGEDLTGKTILLYCEQGFGDSIQFIRYAKLVKAKGACVVVPCPAPLAALFEKIEGIDIVNREGEELPAHDYRAPLLSLPGIFGDIVADIPYIHADKTAWQQKLPAGYKVGIVWRGNPHHTNDHNRSTTPTQFAKLLKGQNITIVNLQKDATADELRILGGAGGVFNPAADLRDFADTAALISALDLVISVDTSVCHLAGALGILVWTLIPFAPDWRWLLDRTDTPWYPSMRLYRQPKIGDWRSVIEAVRTDLTAQTCG